VNSAIYTTNADYYYYYHPSCFLFIPLCFPKQHRQGRHLILQQQLGLGHFGQLGLGHFGQLGARQQHLTQPEHLGLQHSAHLGPHEHFMHLGLKHSGHLGRHSLNLQHLLESVLDLGFRHRFCRIFLRRISVVIFSISWINLQRWRM